MRSSILAGVVLGTTALTALTLSADDTRPVEVAPAAKEAMGRITADSLRGHVSFLASDLLEGRGTPSRGLDLAAEYIAAQFRRAGLEPIGDDGYFQTAAWPYLAPDPESFSCEVKVGDETIRVDAQHASAALTKGLDIAPAAAFKIDAWDQPALEALTPELVAGKVVLAAVPHPYKVPKEQREKANTARRAFLTRMDQLMPALVIDVDRDPEAASGLRRDMARARPAPPRPSPPLLQLHSPQLGRAFDALPAGRTEAIVGVRVGEPRERTAKVRNVVGLLRGADAERKGTYVLLSAHYDHLGLAPHDGSGDRVFNGANDDASGAASVVEVASALATTPGLAPARSLVFIAFYGEEHGLVGSQYYVEHPVVPLDQTVAAINLEQLGRTDDSDGPRVGAATVTGFDYSDVGAILRRAGASIGVDVGKHPTKSDAYFGASDNAAIARAGIPAHTISVAYQFPDYHGAGDEWSKIDYANMAKIDRMVALGLLTIADGPAPNWDADNPKAAPYRAKAKSPR